MFQEVTNHHSVTFLAEDTCIFNGSIDPLQHDEVEYLKLKYNVSDFKFNSGWNSFTQNYYIAALQNVYIEPDHCIAIHGFSSVIKESVFYDWHKVSSKKYLKARLLPLGKIKKLECGILFDGTVGLNYFHFFNDVLTKLHVVKKRFENCHVPLIISNKLYRSALFQFYYQFPFVRNYTWLVLGDNEYFKVKTMYIIKAKQFDGEALRDIAELTVEALKNRASGSKPYEKILINRKEKGGRYISNFYQLEPALAKFGFKTVYMEDVEIAEQVELVRNARLIVGIHGAGLTNLIFTDTQKTQVIEILPKNFSPTHYYWLCNSLSIEYKAFYGGDLLENQGFEVDADRFEKIISRHISKIIQGYK